MFEPDVMCCCCGDLVEDMIVPVPVTYTAPGEDKEEFVVMICRPCALDFEDVRRQPVVEALINAKIARLRNPDKIYKPK